MTRVYLLWLLGQTDYLAFDCDSNLALKRFFGEISFCHYYYLIKKCYPVIG